MLIFLVKRIKEVKEKCQEWIVKRYGLVLLRVYIFKGLVRCMFLRVVNK